MAAPTTKVASSTEESATLLDARIAAQAEEEAMHKGRRLLAALDDARILDLLLGLVEQRAEAGGVVVDLLNSEENRSGIRNLEGQMMLLASISPDLVAPLVHGMAAGAERASEAMHAKDADRPLGLGGLWHALHEPDVNTGMRAMIGFFGGFGAAWREAAEQDTSFTRPTAGQRIPARDRTPGPGGA
ncbi:MAG: DUF1641 domain-containing protein [Thermaerobacter sp.]|nr:DUF1641 domain-containing protein [Thermaerobacter sp.]